MRNSYCPGATIRICCEFFTLALAEIYIFCVDAEYFARFIEEGAFRYWILYCGTKRNAQRNKSCGMPLINTQYEQFRLTKFRANVHMQNSAARNCCARKPSLKFL